MEKDEKMRLQTIRQMGIKYRQISIWITVGIALAVLFACQVSSVGENVVSQMVNPLVVSALFSLVASNTYGVAWASVAKSSPTSLAKFYLAASTLKMMSAAVVFLIYVVVCDKQNILGFSAIFALFYVVLLVFDCIYFARIEKKNKINKE